MRYLQTTLEIVTMNIKRLSITIMLAVTSAVSACRYNIRDVGFLELNTARYLLYGYQYENEPTDFNRNLEIAANGAFLDSNVRYQQVNINTTGYPLALDALKAVAKENPKPSAILSIANRDPIEIDIPADRAGMVDALNGIVSSKLRVSLLDRFKHVYAVVLLVEGKDKSTNEIAKSEIQSAVKALTNVMHSMPKASGKPPIVMTLPFNERQAEKILLWSLGVDLNDAEPTAVILYGRGRMLGELLTGDDLAEREIDRYLSLIGLDCECGLDRKWMTGRRMPLIWDAQQQREAAKLLEFDAEDPRVRQEVSQILMRGPAGHATDIDSLSTDQFTYQEFVIPAVPQEPAKEAPKVDEHMGHNHAHGEHGHDHGHTAAVEAPKKEVEVKADATEDGAPKMDHVKVEPPKSDILDEQAPVKSPMLLYLGVGVMIVIVGVVVLGKK